MRKISLLLLTSILVTFWNCTNVQDWSDPTDEVPPGQITNVQVENINGGAVLRFTMPDDDDLLGAKAIFTFSDSEEQMEVYASEFSDSIMIEGYADTNEHTVQIVAVDKSGNMSPPTTAKIQPLIAPVELVRRTLTANATFSGVRARWKNPLMKPMAISLYATDTISGEMTLYERHYSSAENGGYTFRGFEHVEQAFQLEVSDRWNHTAAPLDTILTPLYEIQIQGMDGTNYIWDLYDYDNSHYRGDPIHANAGNKAAYHARVRSLYDGNTWDNRTYFYVRSATVDQYVAGASSSTFISPAYMTIDMGIPAKYSRFKYFPRGRTPIYSGWSWYEFEVWGTNNPKVYQEIGDGSIDENLKYWTSWSEAGGTDAWKEDWEKLADCEVTFPSGTPNNVGSVTSAEDIAYVMDGFGFDIDPEMTDKAFRYIRFVLKKNNTDNVPYIQWSELQFWGSYE